MSIAGTLTTDVKSTPSAGNLLRVGSDTFSRYANVADDFYMRQLPIFCISPPILNTDPEVFYTYPEGSEQLLGRQTSGLWASRDTTAPGGVYAPDRFFTGFYTSDLKQAMNTVSYFSRAYSYSVSTGGDEGPPSRTTMKWHMTGTTNATDVNVSLTTYDRIHRRGGPLINPSHALFKHADPAVEKYELHYGADASVNYGPFNMSTSDLVSVSSLANEDFRQVRYSPADNGEMLKINVPDLDSFSAPDGWMTLDFSQEITETTFTKNVHVLCSHGHLLRRI